jgi:deaminated glutathione amidase
MKIEIGLIQMTSVLDYQQNLNFIEKELIKAKKKNLKYIFLPECFYTFSNGLKPSPHQMTFENEHFKNISDLANKYSVFLLGGSVSYYSGENSKPYNRALNLSDKGELISYYDKINLFKISLKDQPNDKKVIDESLMFISGKDLNLTKLPDNINLGCAICFDLRFPEIFRKLYTMGTNVISLSAAFTKKTGKAHWHTLLTARAIENQSFVIATAQYGEHNERISTYGHSLVIDPWGEVLLDAKKEIGLHSVVIDLSRVNEIRSRMSVPYLPDLY